MSEGRVPGDPGEMSSPSLAPEPIPLPHRAARVLMRNGVRGGSYYWRLARRLAVAPTATFLRLPAGDVIEWRKQDRLARAVYEGGYERAEMRAVLPLVPRGGTFVDVGANVGVYTMAASRRVGSAGHVIALEPGPACEGLRQAVGLARRSNVTVLEVAASDASGTSVMNEIVGQASLASLNCREGVTGRRTVTMDCLDNVVAKCEIERVDFLKIDTEGSEGPVLRGAERLLGEGRIGAILAELSPEISDDWGLAEALKLIESGFRAYAVTEQGRLMSRPVLTPLTARLLRLLDRQANILFLRS